MLYLPLVSVISVVTDAGCALNLMEVFSAAPRLKPSTSAHGRAEQSHTATFNLLQMTKVVLTECGCLLFLPFVLLHLSITF